MRLHQIDREKILLVQRNNLIRSSKFFKEKLQHFSRPSQCLIHWLWCYPFEPPVKPPIKSGSSVRWNSPRDQGPQLEQHRQGRAQTIKQHPPTTASTTALPPGCTCRNITGLSQPTLFFPAGRQSPASVCNLSSPATRQSPMTHRGT